MDMEDLVENGILQTADEELAVEAIISFPGLDYYESTAERAKKRQRSCKTAIQPQYSAVKRRRTSTTPRNSQLLDNVALAPRLSISTKIDLRIDEHEAVVSKTASNEDSEVATHKHDVQASSSMSILTPRSMEDEDASDLPTLTSAATEFVDSLVDVLEKKIIKQRRNVGSRQARRMLELLKVAKPASQQEGPWLDGDEAAKHVACGYYHDGPIFLHGEQPMPLMSVEEMLQEFYDDNAWISIQDPSEFKHDDSIKDVTVGQVKKRLRAAQPTEYPWNCLEIAAPLEDGTRPRFLHQAECRLLTKIKVGQPDPEGAKVGRRALPYNGKEVEKWVLLAEAGALTEPHQDSHGYNTYITVNEGTYGFGWMHKPTDRQRLEWSRKPHKFINAAWRYRVLKPGDTVYFPAGTVHFVFRHPDRGHTLAFGGHVLRCSTIVQWVQALRYELTNRAVTNEDLTEAGYGYIRQVRTFVQQAMSDGKPAMLDRWGGLESIQTFLKSTDFLLHGDENKTQANEVSNIELPDRKKMGSSMKFTRRTKKDVVGHDMQKAE